VGALVVITTVGTEEQANLIARELVCRRHAACVNVVTGLRSVYRWQGKVCKDTEFLLVIKTLDSEYGEVEAAIRELHSYELPEILAFPVARGSAPFLDWIAGSLDKTLAGCGEGDEDQEEEPLVPLDETNY
jgi:periplasmic divalent cation tolerance protein